MKLIVSSGDVNPLPTPMPMTLYAFYNRRMYEAARIDAKGEGLATGAQMMNTEIIKHILGRPPEPSSAADARCQAASPVSVLPLL